VAFSKARHLGAGTCALYPANQPLPQTFQEKGHTSVGHSRGLYFRGVHPAGGSKLSGTAIRKRVTRTIVRLKRRQSRY
jgi:hypothetical protein